MTVSGRAMVAGVIGRPIGHSLSPRLHGAWIDALGLDALYAPFEPGEGGFARLVGGLCAGGVRGVNVTLPFKEEALALADVRSEAAEAAGAANLLLFRPDGRMEADNTDGVGLLQAFAEQAPAVDLTSGPVVILGAGGASRGALAALKGASLGELRIVNRTVGRAEALAAQFGGRAFGLDQAAEAFAGAAAVIHSTSAGLADTGSIDWPSEVLPAGAAVMDMVYKPLVTPLLAKAKEHGLTIVDGLAMLIGQARPSFEAFYGVAPPAEIDVRTGLLEALG